MYMGRGRGHRAMRGGSRVAVAAWFLCVHVHARAHGELAGAGAMAPAAHVQAARAPHEADREVEARCDPALGATGHPPARNARPQQRKSALRTEVR